jgi:hypothetical protein
VIGMIVKAALCAGRTVIGANDLRAVICISAMRPAGQGEATLTGIGQVAVEPTKLRSTRISR